MTMVAPTYDELSTWFGAESRLEVGTLKAAPSSDAKVRLIWSDGTEDTICVARLIPLTDAEAADKAARDKALALQREDIRHGGLVGHHILVHLNARHALDPAPVGRTYLEDYSDRVARVVSWVAEDSRRRPLRAHQLEWRVP
jgi:hypothetical protein